MLLAFASRPVLVSTAILSNIWAQTGRPDLLDCPYLAPKLSSIMRWADRPMCVAGGDLQKNNEHKQKNTQADAVHSDRFRPVSAFSEAPTSKHQAINGAFFFHIWLLVAGATANFSS